MLIAKWQIDARFGHKQKVIDKLKIGAWLKNHPFWVTPAMKFHPP